MIPGVTQEDQWQDKGVILASFLSHHEMTKGGLKTVAAEVRRRTLGRAMDLLEVAAVEGIVRSGGDVVEKDRR